MELRPGIRVGRAVELVRPLGGGAVGSVWVARHTALDAEVAVKFIAGRLAKSDSAFIGRFKREASVAANIKSPHVVRTFDYGVIDGVPYIVMELLEGESLFDRLARQRRLTPGQTAQLVRQVCRALRKAHKEGIVHRDLKPDNLFLVHLEDEEESGELFVKILDFGVAKQRYGKDESLLTAPGALAGTPAYMSPEHIMSAQETDAQADLWSLAVIAYECITGRLPFDGDTIGQLFRAIDRAELTPPSEVLGVPLPAFDAFCARAMSRFVEDRYENAGALTTALDEALLGSSPGDSSLRLPVLRDEDVVEDALSTQPTLVTGSGARPAEILDTAVPITTMTGRAPRSRSRAAVYLGLGVMASVLALAGIWVALVGAESDGAPAAVDETEAMELDPEPLAPAASGPELTETTAPEPEPVPSAEPSASASAAPTIDLDEVPPQPRPVLPRPVAPPKPKPDVPFVMDER